MPALSKLVLVVPTTCVVLACASSPPPARAPSALARPPATRPSAAPTVASVAPAPPSATAAAPTTTTPAREAFRGEPLDALLDAMAHRPVARRVARFDSTTVVYRLALEGGGEIGFKPSVTTNPELWRHEVAAYRLARCLGLGDRVPPAVVRRVPLAALGEGTARDHVATLPDAPDAVVGAATYWMPVLGHSDLHTPEGEARWRAWLRAEGPAPTGEEGALAEQVSTLIVFDYLQGNDDRWSRYNLRTDERGALIYRDNNAGWIARQMADPAWQRARLERVQRFRRSVIAALERTDARALAAELARDPGPDGAPVLSARHLRAYDVRRRVVLDHVRSVAARLGDASVYAWP